MKPARRPYAALTLIAFFSVACSPAPDEPPEPGAGAQSPDLEETVARMAAIGWAYGGSWSPDGARIAYISAASGSPQAWIHDIASRDSTQATHFRDQVDGVEWGPDADTLTVSVAPGGGLNTQIYFVQIGGGEPRRITAGGNDNNWLGEFSKDGRFLTFSSNVRGDDSMHCYVYDLENDETRLIAENDGIGVTAAVAPGGGRAVIWRMRSRGNTDLYLLDIASGEEQLLTPHEGVAESDAARFLADDILLVTTNIDREMVALGRIDIDDSGVAGPIRIVAARDDAELEGLEVVQGSERVALLWNAAGRSELAWLDVADESLEAGPALPAEIAGGLRATEDGRQLAMTLSGAATPQDVWRLDVASGRFERISASAHDGVDLESLVRPRLVRYRAHDGLELSGWLYRPPDTDGPGPVVASFHGGPEGQERPRFRATYQALLARGISVFAPNVRGSAGFGKTFINLDNGALRFDGVRDIKATVDHLIDSGVADPQRIGIMGGSYGGYMVMAGLTEYPDLFGAGANLFGVVNFETFFANTEPWMAAISTVEYGDPATEADLLRRLSPIHKVDRVTAPTIVLHGANDTNVPVVEAEQVVASLEQRGIPVKYVLFPDEGHGWRKTANRVRSDVEIVRWFETHL